MSSYAPLPPAEIAWMAQLVADSFNMPEDKCELWIRRSGLENWRALKDQTLLGGLMRIPMAQWFGGRQVSMTGLAGVAVAATGRGQRIGQRLMRESLSEMHAEGTAVSALYGSTTSFYRRCGYERAGF
jgi:predicted acetyltransferase